MWSKDFYRNTAPAENYNKFVVIIGHISAPVAKIQCNFGIKFSGRSQNLTGQNHPAML